MAATKIKAHRLPRAEFEIPLADALALLLRTQDVAPGDGWDFRIYLDTLRITRNRAPIEDPVEPSASVAGEGRRAAGQR